MDQINTFTLATGWRARLKADVPVDGTVLTSPSYSVAGWLDAVVPGSVIATLVKNNKIPDPYYGNNSNSTPDTDISKVGNAYYTYWFYNAFQLPTLAPSRRVALCFDGINYGAEIYFNGRKLGVAVGMFRRHVFEITPLVGAENRLAVLVTPPDPPGIPDGNGGQSGSPNIGESVVARYPVGWDWVNRMRDRSTGIWDRVSVYVSGPVVIGDPRVVTRVPGVRVPEGAQPPAYLTVTAEVTNSSNTSVSGVLSCAVDGQTDRENVTLAAGETRAITFNRQIDNPRLWWPNGLGQPELYPVTLTFTIGTDVSDQRSFRIGVRQIDVPTMEVSSFGGKRKTRVFYINGQRVFIRGGNWIGTDAMFRYSTDAKRYRDEVRMHAAANLNAIRVWGGGIAERDPFYEACDEHGIMVMQDFWLSGEFTGDFSNTWTEVFEASAQETIKRLQHHPSLLFWSGANETTPPPGIDDLLRGWIEGTPGIKLLDGSRVYVNCSTNISGSSQNVNEDGPYGILNPAEFFQQPVSNPINPELGSVGTPTYESLRRFIPDDALKNFPVPGQPYDKVGEIWHTHDYIPYFYDSNNPIVSDQIGIYGSPSSAETFAYLAQLANYIQYRALFEGFTAQMWESYVGVFVWKSQNPWTGLRGQLYDWYLEQTGGLFGVRSACEPVHVQLDLSNNKVMLVNTTAAVFEGTATATIYDLSGRATYGGSIIARQSPGTAQSLFPLQNVPTTPSTVYFVDLHLSNRQGKTISTNLYWLTTADYRPLRQLGEAKIASTGTLARSNERWHATVTLVSATAQPVAFWIRLQVLTSGERVLPVFYSDNYFSLVPGERRDIVIDFAASDVPPGAVPEVWFEGWNVVRTQVRLTPRT